jgi:hypothetical protein
MNPAVVAWPGELRSLTLAEKWNGRTWQVQSTVNQ